MAPPKAAIVVVSSVEKWTHCAAVISVPAINCVPSVSSHMDAMHATMASTFLAVEASNAGEARLRHFSRTQMGSWFTSAQIAHRFLLPGECSSANQLPYLSRT